MSCQRCIDAIQTAGIVLHELAFCDADALLPGRDWNAVGTDLIRLAGHLRTLNVPKEHQYGGKAKEADGPAAEAAD